MLIQKQAICDSTIYDTIGTSDISIGRFTYGYDAVKVRQWDEGASLTIGSFCSLSEMTIILGNGHRSDWITSYPFGKIYSDELIDVSIPDQSSTNGNVIIGNDVWIGRKVTIMSGVTIGDGAVVAANSTVVKDVEPYSIVGGNPAKQLSYRFDHSIIQLLCRLKWWDLDLECIKVIIPKLSCTPDIRLLTKLYNEFRNK